MKFGLSDDQLRQVQAILSKYPAITEAVVFGSRAMGNYKEASDVDMALKGNITLSMVADVKYELEEDTYLPFFFDVIAYGIIDAPKLKEHIDQYGKLLYRAGWTECRLGDCVLINSRSVDKNYPHSEIEYLDTGSITRGKIESLQRFQLTDAPSRAKRIVKDNDIVLSMVRPIQRHYGFLKNVPPNMVASTGFVVLTCKDEIDPYFLYSFLTQEDVTEHLDMIAEGSTSAYPAFTPDVVENISINLPPLQEQRAISVVLSSLDAKIDFLHRQSNTLEGIASALWWKVFVEEAAPGWKKVHMSEIIEVRDGTHDSPKQAESGFYLITSRHLKEEGIDYANAYRISEQDYNQINRRSKVDENDLLFSMIGTLGLIHYVDNEPLYAIKNIGLFKTSKKPEFAKYLYLLLKSPIGKDFVFENAEGSTQEYISLGSLRSFAFSYPGDQNIKLFDEMVEPYFDKIHRNKQQIRILSRLRDALLPKLLSGEAKVKIDA